jgi:hypothetical protein
LTAPRGFSLFLSLNVSRIGSFIDLLALFSLFWNNRFVIDAADHDKLDAARTELRNLLDKPQLAEIPVLVLGNKNDLPGALTVEEIIETM